MYSPARSAASITSSPLRATTGLPFSVIATASGSGSGSATVSAASPSSPTSAASGSSPCSTGDATSASRSVSRTSAVLGASVLVSSVSAVLGSSVLVSSSAAMSVTSHGDSGDGDRAPHLARGHPGRKRFGEQRQCRVDRHVRRGADETDRRHLVRERHGLEPEPLARGVGHLAGADRLSDL